MIVLVDINKKSLNLYSNDGLIQIPFDQAHTVEQYANAEKIYYITNAVEVDMIDIVNLVRKMGVIVGDASKKIVGNKYIHAVEDGTLYISEDLKFEGKFDLKLIDSDISTILEENDIVKKLLRNGKIEIIGEFKKTALFKELKKVEEKKIEIQKKVDKKLEGIILDMRVDDWDGTISGDDEDNVIEIDLEKGGKVGEGVSGVDTMSELFNKIEKEVE